MFRNFLTLSTGELVARAVHAVTFLLLARALKPEGLGVFELAVAVTSYAVLIVQQGFDTIAIREISRDRSRAIPWARNIFGVRLALALVVSAGVAGGAAIFGLARPASILVLVLCANYWIGALSLRWVFLALERPREPAIASALSQAVFLGVVILAVHSPPQAWRAAVGWVAGESAAAALLWSLLDWRNEKRLPAWSSAFSKQLLRESWPVSVSLLLGQMLFNFDVLALAALGHSKDIGFYLAAYRCVTAFTPVITQFQLSIFPSFARQHSNRIELLYRARRLALGAGLVGVAAAAALALGARVILGTLFGAEYQQGAEYLEILAWILPVMAMRGVFRQVLLACNHQTSDTRNIAFGAAANAILDLALVPRWGALGCSWSTISSELVLLTATWSAVRTKALKGAG